MPDLRVDAVENEAKQVVPEPSGIALVAYGLRFRRRGFFFCRRV
jgi:hypothetical protein